MQDKLYDSLYCLTAGNGEDNIIIGLSIDNVSQDIQAKINFGEENEVLPCCVLVCLTVDGKLTFFHFAR